MELRNKITFGERNLMKKIIFILLVCMLMSACTNTNPAQIKKVENQEDVLFYDRDEKIAHNDEFNKGSGIKSIDMNEKNVENIFVLAKVWGYLKYHHPNVAQGEYNWDYELFRVLPKVINIDSTEERDKILCAWIDSLGSFESINEGEPNTIPVLEYKFSDDLENRLLNIQNAKRENSNFYVSLVDEVGNPNFINEKAYSLMGYPDAGYRLLSLFRYWNIIEYYFPYKHLIEENWEDVLKEFIPKFINASNELEYKLSVLELIGRIHDTHANIWSNDKTLERYWGEKYAPVIITFVENKAVVTDYYHTKLGEKSKLKIGDIITKINGVPVEEIVSNKLKYIPASNYPTQLRNIARVLLRTNDYVLHIELIHNEEIKSVDVACYSASTLNLKRYYENLQKQKVFYKLIDSDIAYIYPEAVRDRELSEIMKEVENTKGLIIDLRGYPSESIVYSLAEYLLPENTEFVQYTAGSLLTPGHFTVKGTLSVGKKNEDYYKGKVIILVNEKTQSHAEFTAMALRTAPEATVIGSTTAGADGNVSYFYLPGGILTAISGIGIYYPDGSETQRVGIVPDIEVKTTIAGVQLNKDELLEKAIKVINE